MSTVSTWKAFIDAQQILADQYSEPFEIRVTKIQNGEIKGEVVEDNQQWKILPKLKNAFPDLPEDLRLNSDYFSYPYNGRINSNNLIELKSFAENNYFDFNPKPCISGTIQYEEDIFQKFLEKHFEDKGIGGDSNLADSNFAKEYFTDNHSDKDIAWKDGERLFLIDEFYLTEEVLNKFKRIYHIEYTLSYKKISTDPKIQYKNKFVKQISFNSKKNKVTIYIEPNAGKNEILDIIAAIDTELSNKHGKIHRRFRTSFRIKDNRNKFHRKKSIRNVQFLTIDEIKHIDKILSDSNTIERNKDIGAIYKANFSEIFIDKQLTIARNYLQEILGISNYDVHGYNKQIHLKNIFLNRGALEKFIENTFYSDTFHKVIFRINEEVFNSFLETRSDKRIWFNSEYNGKTSKVRGVTLPDPHDNTWELFFNWQIELPELRYQTKFLHNILKRYFPPESIEICHEHVLRIDKNRFLDSIRNEVSSSGFQVSLDSETISFDFTDDAELAEKLEQLDRISTIDYQGFLGDHKYKVEFNSNSPLEKLSDVLTTIPSISIKFRRNEPKAKIICFFEEEATLPALKSRIKNKIDSFGDDKISLKWDTDSPGDLKYWLSFDKERYGDDLRKQLDNLRGENIKIVGKHESLGTLKKVNFPKIVISDVLTEEADIEGEVLMIHGDLKGEKDKIKRLSFTLSAIFSQKSNNIVNENLKTILLDSSSASSFEGNILFTNEFKELVQQIKSDRLSKYINERQVEAIAKSLLSEDIFMIQGPPGTGKSTVIAELIWQHIKQQSGKKPYRILVTSETNLAVDNALEKLRNTGHMLIKPFRFGSESKLEEEGKKYSLEALKNWKSGIDVEENNIIEDWIDQIKFRAKHYLNEENERFIELWANHLESKNEEVRSVFYNRYLNNCNVVGATCSSIGKINSEDRFTRFFFDYLNVYQNEDYKKFDKSPNRHTIGNLENHRIEFDLVIQDEASKASPPELALPCIYGRKSIIIGDHNQLPPMIDTSEFIDNLNMLKDRSKTTEQIKSINKLIRYLSANKHEFEVCHFEILFKNIDENLRSTFNLQYRMHPAINETVKQFYLDEGGLECGLINPIDLGVNDTDLNNFASRYHGLTKNPNIHVMWFDVNSPEMKIGTSRVNYGEIEAVNWIINKITEKESYNRFVNHWSESQRSEKEIGVITFYGAQSYQLWKNCPSSIPIRVSPVDRFQGMERNIIIVSLVRSNCIAESKNQLPDYDLYEELGYQKQESLGFAEFPNRLNVALSRAKRLLIIVGNSTHFRKRQIYNNVYNTIQNHPSGEVYDYEQLLNRT